MQKIRRVLTILLIVLLVLGGLGLAAFTWFAFWPLEKGVDRIVALVPGDVDFVMRTSWHGLKETGWIQENVLEDPLVPPDALARLSGRRPDRQAPAQTPADVVEGLVARVEQMEAEINQQIPLGLATFSFEEDVVPGDIVVAGKWCDGLDPAESPPGWYEILVLTRISWKPKFFAALKHGFVRKQFAGRMQVDEVEEDIYRFTLPGVPVTSERARTCGQGQVVPPQNVWYGTRVRNVLAFSNALSLARGVRELAAFPDSGRAYVNRPHVEVNLLENGIAASMDISPLHNYLVRALDAVGRPVTILKRYLTIPALHRLNGYLALPSHDQIHARATVRYQEGLLGRGVDSVYGLTPEPPGSLVAGLVPAEDTFGALLLKTPALHLLRGIYEDILSPPARELWQNNLRAMGGYSDIDDFFQEFSGKLADTAGIAVARMGDVYDTLEYPEFFTTDPLAHPNPEFPALAMIVRLRKGTLPEEFDAYLAARIPLLGADSELVQKEYRGFRYTRVNLQQELADFVLFTPCWILAQGHFIFASNEGYFRKLLDTLADPKAHPPLSDDPTFRAAMDELPDQVHVAVFVDLEKLFRVPPAGALEGGPRGYLFDRRNMWVFQHRSARAAAIDYRRELTEAWRARTGRAPTDQQALEIEERVAEMVDRHLERYADFEAEYRDVLAEFARLRAVGVGILAQGEHLVADLSVLFRQPAPPSP